MAGISGKVSAQYSGRSALCLNSSSPRRVERTKRTEKFSDCSAEVSRGHSNSDESWNEGLNVKKKKKEKKFKELDFDEERDADNE